MAFQGSPERTLSRSGGFPPTLGEFHSGERVPSTAEVVVIGGGIVGAATTFYLAMAGLSPVLVESGSHLGNLTTENSAHGLHAQFEDPVKIKMMSESIATYANFAAVLGLPAEKVDIHFTTQGYLFATTARTGPAQLRARVERQQAAGLADVEYLDGDEARHRFPWLAPEVTAATFRAGDGWMDSCAATEAFVLASGARAYLETEVRAIRRDGGRVTGVETDHGTISTNLVVLAAGPFTQTLAGEPLPVTLVRGHRLVVPAQPEIPLDAPVVVDVASGAYWRPYQDGALLGWPRNEAPGPPLAPVPVNPTFPNMVLRDSEGVGRLTPFWREVAPRLRPDELWLVAGQYDNTPDQKPLIGRSRVTEGLWIHAGYGNCGIMGSPSGARILAELITGSLRAEDNPFDPHRFEHRATEITHERILL